MMGVLGFFVALVSAARPLVFDLQDSVATVGDTINIEIVALSLVGVEPPTIISEFDFDVNWDDTSIVTLTGVTFGSLLGDPDPFMFETITGASIDNGAGIASVDELSLLWSLFPPSPLEILQDFGNIDISLLTLHFSADNVGVTNLSLTPGIIDLFGGGPDGFLGDELGTLIPVTPFGGTITVEAPIIPEPGTLLFTFLGLVGLAIGRRNIKS